MNILSGHRAFNKPPAAYQAAFICPVCPGVSLRSTPGCIPPTFQAEGGLVPREEMKNQLVYKDIGCTYDWRVIKRLHVTKIKIQIAYVNIISTHQARMTGISRSLFNVLILCRPVRSSC